MTGIVQNNPANDPDKKPFKSRSRFKPNVSIFQTARFGEATPFYAAEVVPDDQNFSLRVNSDVDTMTLKSPLMSPLRMNKDYFFAPLRSILPHNADRLVTNPLTGDDVDARNVNCVLLNSLIPKIASVNYAGNYPLWADLRVAAIATPAASATMSVVHNFVIKMLMCYRVGWYIFSTGSLARNLGYNWHNFFVGPQANDSKRRLTFDEYFDALFSWMSEHIEYFDATIHTGMNITGETTSQCTGKNVRVYCSLDEVTNPTNQAINLRQLIYLMQQGAYVYYVQNFSLKSEISEMFPVLPQGMAELGFTADSFNYLRFGVFGSRELNTIVTTDETDTLAAGQHYYNFSRLVGYQLACMQFYTTDSVDYVYNCELWHENQLSLYRLQDRDYFNQYLFYLHNGARLQYDSVSGNILRRMANRVCITNTNSVFTVTDQYGQFTGYATVGIALFYWANILGFNRSLKFRDYFVGSKVAPLAVGDVNVQVSSGEFSVVDVTKNIMRQRFLNQVNRVGRSLKEYSRGIFGANPVYDPHEVVFLGSTTDIIGAEETQNTGSGQREEQAKTSHFRGESSKFAFEGSFQEFGVVIGVMTFDVARPYSNNADGALFHLDRFEMFNPYMQTIGDQAVIGSEVDGQQNITNQGYQMRYMEYRQRVDYAAGGFIHYLPGYCFLADYRSISDIGSADIKISPDFIRSRSYEFDDLYQVLDKFTPAGYFHFIIRHDCQVSCDRPMLAAPTIL